METWKILIVSLLAAVLIGTVGGISIGKILVKRARSDRKPLLSKKERLIYATCLIIGTASILFGVFYDFPTPGDFEMNSDMITFTEEGDTAKTPARASGGGNAGYVVRRSNGGAVRIRG